MFVCVHRTLIVFILQMIFKYSCAFPVDNFCLFFFGMIGMIGMAGITPPLLKNDKQKLPRKLLYGATRFLHCDFSFITRGLYFGSFNCMIYFRKIVPLGRSCGVTIPKEIVRDLGWSPCDDVAIFVTKDSEVLIKRMAPCEVSAFVSSFEPIKSID